MRVLAVSTWYPTPAAPTAGVFVQKDTHVLALDHDVVMVHLAPSAAYASAPPDEAESGVRVIRVPFDARYPRLVVSARRRLAELARHADLVHTSAFSTLAAFVPARPGVPWVHTEHWSGISAPESVAWWWRVALPLAGRALAAPDVVVPVCEYLATSVRPFRKGPVMVVPCLVDSPADTVLRPSAAEVLRLVSVGGLVPGKDPLMAVEAVAELRRQGVPTRLTWVGDGPMRGAVIERRDALGLTAEVELAGALPPGGVVARLAEADMFLLPTLHENFCVSAAEALRVGRPVVVGATGGQAEYVDGSVGALVSDQSPAAYAHAVLEVRRRLEGASAEDLARGVRERFSASAVRAGYQAVYARAAEERAERR